MSGTPQKHGSARLFRRAMIVAALLGGPMIGAWGDDKGGDLFNLDGPPQQLTNALPPLPPPPEPRAATPAAAPVPVPTPTLAPALVPAPTPTATAAPEADTVKVTVKPVGAATSSNGLVTNIWVDADIRQVVQDISSQTDTVIICDHTVQGIVSMSVKDMSVPDCLERVCAVGGYSFTKIKDYYVMGKADPGSPIFQKIAEPVRVRLAHILPEQAKTLLTPSLLQYVTFDKASGTVVISAPDPIRDRVLKTINLIDQPNSQVAIEAVVFELTESGSKDLAMDWEFKTPHFDVQSQGLVNTITYGAGSDLGTYVNMTLHAIVESGKGQVLANPKVLVLNNTDAEIFVGQEQYFTLLSGQASNPYYTLQSIKAGVTLKVNPSIGANGRITLSLEPEVSDVEDDSTLVASTQPASASSNPVVTRRHAKTTVDINDGQTLMIGGLIMDQRRSVIDKNPFLGDIPVAGAPFRSVQTSNVRQEVVILITCHLVEDAKNLTDKVTSRLTQHYVTPLDAVAIPEKGHK